MSDDGDDVRQEAADYAWEQLSRRFEHGRIECPDWITLKAFHEAGHAVAGWLHRKTFGGAGILPYEAHDGGEAGGAVLFLGSDGRSPSLADIIINFAGPAAARRHAPRSMDGGTSDREEVERFLAMICRTAEAADVIRKHCRAEAERIVAANWDAVEAVAEALLRCEQLTSADLAKIFDGVAIDRANAAKPARGAAWALAQEHAASFAAMTRSM